MKISLQLPQGVDPNEREQDKAAALSDRIRGRVNPSNRRYFFSVQHYDGKFILSDDRETHGPNPRQMKL